jgi:hypothetical protein
MSTPDTDTATEVGTDFEADLTRVGKTVSDAIRSGREENPQFLTDAIDRGRQMTEQAQADDASPAEVAAAAWFLILSIHSEE